MLPKASVFNHLLCQPQRILKLISSPILRSIMTLSPNPDTQKKEVQTPISFSRWIQMSTISSIILKILPISLKKSFAKFTIKETITTTMVATTLTFSGTSQRMVTPRPSNQSRSWISLEKVGEKFRTLLILPSLFIKEKVPLKIKKESDLPHSRDTLLILLLLGRTISKAEIDQPQLNITRFAL